MNTSTGLLDEHYAEYCEHDGNCLFQPDRFGSWIRDEIDDLIEDFKEPFRRSEEFRQSHLTRSKKEARILVYLVSFRALH